LHVRGPYFVPGGALAARLRRGRERREHEQLEPVVMEELQPELAELDRPAAMRR
jgi:hypothetical protein